MTRLRKPSAMIVSGLLLMQSIGTASAAAPAAAPATTAAAVAANTQFTPSSQLTAALNKARAAQLNSNTVMAKREQQLGLKGTRDFQGDRLTQEASAYKPDDKVRVIVQTGGTSVSERVASTGRSIQSVDANMAATAVREAAAQRDGVVSAARSNGISMQVRHSYATAISGFSAEVRYGDVSKLAQLPGVKQVTVAQRYLPLDNNTTKLVGADKLWSQESPVDGTGMVIAIIDTGVDYRHPDLGKQTRLDPNGKVIGGWNFADRNSQVLDFSGSGHGTHVAGIAAATGEGPEHLKGMAPKAQIIAQKVFSNEIDNPYAYTDDLVAAIDDAVNANSPYHPGVAANVLNMSLGSTSGFADPEDPEQKAIANAVRAGAVAAISAGNSAFSSEKLNKAPYWFNQDIATVGAPGTAPEAITVASSMNTMLTIQGRGLVATIDGKKYAGENFNVYLDGSGPYGAFQKLSAASLTLAIPSGDPIGCDPADWNGVNLAGKAALISRGTCTFQEKTDFAAQAGARAVIIFNNKPDPDLFGMPVDKATVPSVMVMKNFGTDLYNAAAADKVVKVAFNGAEVNRQMPDPNGDTMADYSSWGTTPDLGFKPDLTAPGGNIYSTLPSGQYGVMGGTSMAAPHVAGAAALVKQAHPNYQPADIKAALMNTAKQLISPYSHTPYSPRQQGSGRIQVDKAVSTHVVVTANGSPSLSLGAVVPSSVTPFTLTVNNTGDSDATFDLTGSVYTPAMDSDKDGKEYNVLDSAELSGAGISFNGQTAITVPAGESIQVNGTLDLSEANPDSDWTDYGYFAEGFISLKSHDAAQPDLTMPYISYVGHWNGPDSPPVVDLMKDNLTFTGKTWLWSPFGKDYFGLGVTLNNQFDSNLAAISNDAALSTQNAVVPTIARLRNAKQSVVEVVGENGELVDRIATEHDLRKNLADDLTDLVGQYKWDGKAYNRKIGRRVPVPDGQYYIQVRSLTVGAGSEDWQTIQMPIKVDSVAPVIDMTSLKPAVAGKYTFQFKASDRNQSGIFAVVPVMDDKIVGDWFLPEHDPADPAEILTGSAEINIPLGKHGWVGLCAFDYAGNQSCYGWETVDLQNNGAIALVGTGKITTKEATATLPYTISADVQLVTYQEGESEGVPVGKDSAGDWKKGATVPIRKDGVYNFTVNAYADEAGTQLLGQVTYTVDADMTPPALDFTKPDPRSTAFAKTIDFEGTVSEAHPKDSGIRYSTDAGTTWKTLTPAANGSFKFSVEYKSAGRQNVLFKAEDALGNMVEFTRVVYIDGGAPVITTPFDPLTGPVPSNIDVLVSGYMNYELTGTTSDDTGYTFSIMGEPQYEVTADSAPAHEWSYTIAGLGGDSMPFPDYAAKVKANFVPPFPFPFPIPGGDGRPSVDAQAVLLEAKDFNGVATQRTLSFKNKARVITMDVERNPVAGKVKVEGTIAPDVTSVTVNGVAASIANGTFRAELPMQYGVHQVAALARTSDPSRVGLALDSYYGSPVTITSPEWFTTTKGNSDGTVTVTGIVDLRRKETLRINGILVPADQIAANGTWSVKVAADMDGTPFQSGRGYVLQVAVGDSEEDGWWDYTIFGFDTTPPEVNVTLPEADVYQNSVMVTIDVSDMDLYEGSLTLNGKPLDVSDSDHFEEEVALTTDGDTTITVVATDSAGNTKTVTKTIAVDAKAPELTVNLQDGQGVTSPVNVTGTAKDAHLTTFDFGSGPVPVVMLQLDNSEAIPVAVDSTGKFAFEMPLPLITEGVIKVTAADQFGHVTTKSFRIVISTVLKSLTVTPAEKWSPTASKLKISYGLATRTAISVDVFKDDTFVTNIYRGTPRTVNSSIEWDGKANRKLVADGDYEIRLTAGSISLKRTITVTTAKPVVTEVKTEGGTTTNADSVTIYGTAPNAASVTVSVSGPTSRIKAQTAPVDQSGTFSLTFIMKGAPDGDYKFSAVSKDAAGNLSDAKILKITRKATAPAKPAVTMAKKVINSSTLELTVSASQAGRLTIHSLNGLTLGGWDDEQEEWAQDYSAAVAATRNNKITVNLPDGESDLDVSWLDDGRYDFQAWVTDAAGNKSAAVTFTVIVDRTKADVKFTSAATGAKGKTYTLTGKVTDAQGIASVKVNGSKVTLRRDGSFSYSKSLPSQGGKTTFTIIVVDNAGNTTTETFEVTAN